MPIASPPSISGAGEGADLIRAWCARNGFPCASDGAGELRIRTVRSGEAKYAYIPETGVLSDEIYELELGGALPRATATITYSGARGLRHALNTVARKLRRNDWRAGREFDYPRFPIRGIIEGFYGRPWSHEQRLDMLAYLASLGMNAYVYAPKDDEKHRRRWREPYDQAAGERLAELVRESAALGLDFYYCIAPGLTMRYTSEADYAALLGKLRQLYGLGVRRFGLLLDDIPNRLQHPEDADAFADLAEAHVRLINRCHDELLAWNAANRLVVCPTQYCGRGDEYYIARLGGGLDPRVDLFWTGRNICSQELTLAEAAAFARGALRKPLYWDNYPVNDLEMADECHIGPYRGRDPHLYRFSRGVIANGMESPASSKIAFATIADYLWDPVGYDPETSWNEALERQVEPRLLPAFRMFADNVRYSCLYPTDSPLLAEELERFGFDFAFGSPRAALERLGRFAGEMQAASKVLLARLLDGQPLLRELERWLNQYAQGCELLRECLDCLHLSLDRPAAGGEYARALERLRERHLAFRGNPARVFADVLDTFVRQVLEQRYAPISNPQ